MAAVEPYHEPFPWRTATLVASAVAGAELIGLFMVCAFVLAHPFRHHAKAHTATTAAKPTVHHAPKQHRHVVPVPAKDRVKVKAHPLRPRSKMRVLVLNANGVQGAAHVEAMRLQGLGYVIGGAANAPSHHYSRSMVMFVPGYLKEARRLAHDVRIKLVAPVDGLTPSSLSGSRLVVLLGS